uniref:Uncharacterized protein n=1 Tax=Anguilla anguilla TaxID=7936 RepID=A0A0E9WVF2_ANGAN
MQAPLVCSFSLTANSVLKPVCFACVFIFRCHNLKSASETSVHTVINCWKGNVCFSFSIRDKAGAKFRPWGISKTCWSDGPLSQAEER